MLVVALNLRIAIVGLGPLLDDIRHDTGMSSALAGTLATIPFLCMGVFALAGLPVLRRWGVERLIGGALLCVGGGTLLRAAMPTAAGVVVATIPIGIGIAEPQPFIDGNKRAAPVAMLTFLEINGSRLHATDPELATWIVDLGVGSTPEDLANKVRRAAQPAA